MPYKDISVCHRTVIQSNSQFQLDLPRNIKKN